MKESDDLRAPLAFLLGKLDFRRDFKRFLLRAQGPDYSITAEPKSDRASFSQVQFVVAPDYSIRALEITSQDNSVMLYRFAQEKLNPPVAEKLFQFRPPAGAEVVEGEQ